MIDFKTHVGRMLEIGRELVRKNPGAVGETGRVNTKGDKTIAMDALIEQAFLDYLKREKLPVVVFSEEIGTVRLANRPEYIVAFDPLDGSTNYRVGRGLLPFGTLVAVFAGLNPKLKDIVAAGAVEYTRNRRWLSAAGKTVDEQGKAVTIGDWPVEGSTPVYLDIYKADYYQAYLPVAGKLYIRNTGSTVGNLAQVLAGTAAGMGHPRIRSEEVGAVYGLVAGAGGVILDHQGHDLGEAKFTADKVYPLLAGSGTAMKFAAESIDKG